jgi:hypothetical protein
MEKDLEVAREGNPIEKPKSSAFKPSPILR